MALKKSQLYSSLWQSCDELRGGMDASQYKDYVLTLLFMKYVLDKYAGSPDTLIEVPEGGFADMVKLKGDKKIGDQINTIIGELAEVNDLKGVIDQADFNDESKLGAGKEMQDRLSRLVAIFEGLDFRANRAEGDDLLGDAYEYLIRHFATESGKSKGQFYTPAEVTRIMAEVVGIGLDTQQNQTIYDRPVVPVRFCSRPRTADCDYTGPPCGYRTGWPALLAWVFFVDLPGKIRGSRLPMATKVVSNVYAQWGEGIKFPTVH